MIYVAQFVAKVLLSGALLLFAGVLSWQAWRVWFNRSLVLAPFDYLENGKPATDSGEQFSRMVRVDLEQLARLYDAGAVHNAAAVPNIAGAEPAVPMEMPTGFDSVFDSIELTAYGIQFGSIFKSVRRWIESPSEISGTVTHQGDDYAVFAELRRPGRGPESRQQWNVQYSKDVPEATRNVACRIFRSLATSSNGPKGDADLFRAVDDEDFCLFNRALAAYDQFRVRKAVAPDDAAKLLATADGALTNLRTRNLVTFPYVHKLSALVLYEQAKYADAEGELARYQDWAQKSGRNDAFVADLQDKIRKKKLEVTPAMSVVRPLRPGTSVGLLNESKRAGLICCLVKDADGRRYLLSAQQALGKVVGAKVVQPAAADGGTAQEVVGEVVKVARTAAIASIHDDVKWDATVLAAGAIKGVESNPAVDQAVMAYGFDGQRHQAVVVSTGTTLAVTDAGTGEVVTVDNAIVTGDIAPDEAVGAPVLTVADGKIIGMVYGVT